MRFTVKQDRLAEGFTSPCGVFAAGLVILGRAPGLLERRSSRRDIQHLTGRMALKFLLATLLVSPLARYAKQPLLIRVRRLLGLWCFAPATLHLTSYTLLELGINNLALLGSEIITRPYLTLGMISWAILLALAVTSTQAMQRKLGRRWQLLHNFVYLVAILAPIHYLWSVKIVSPQPVIYALLAAALLTWRYKKFRQWWRAIR